MPYTGNQSIPHGKHCFLDMDKFAHTSDGIFEIQRGITASFMIQAPGLIEGIKLIVPGRNILESSNLFFALRGFLDFFASDVICDHLAWLEENCLVLNAPDYHSQAALFIINVRSLMSEIRHMPFCDPGNLS